MQTEEKKIFHRFIENTDWIMAGAVIFLIISGLISVYSAVLNLGNPGKYIYTQLTAVSIGFILMLIMLGINYQLYRNWTMAIYMLSVILLVAVLFGGVTIRGTKGWFNLGLFSFQPVEIARLMFIISLAGYVEKNIKIIKSLSVMTVVLLMLGGHIVLLMLQPDFSSTLPYFFVTFTILYAAGASLNFILGLALFGVLAAGIPLMATFLKLQPALIKSQPVLRYLMEAAVSGGWKALILLSGTSAFIFIFWWFLRRFRLNVPVVYPGIICLIFLSGSLSSFFVQKAMKEYQRKRLIVFLNPDIDPLGSGYNIIQSKIALGSGKITGRGIFEGRQTQLRFLPEQHTDYIFAVIGEETGYIFSQLILAGLFILVWRAMMVSREARDRYGSLISAVIAALFAFSIVVNVGMVMGVMPTAGIPLTLISYGGSNMVSTLIALGLLFSIHIRRYTN